MEDTIITPNEAAKILRCSLRLIYRQLKAGRIPSVRLGDRYLIPRIAFNKWLECKDKGH